MSENEVGDGKVGAFLLGFLAGVLVCVGAGGVLLAVQTRVQTERAVAAEQEAERVLMEAERERGRGEEAFQQAVDAGRKAEAAKAKEGN